MNQDIYKGSFVDREPQAFGDYYAGGDITVTAVSTAPVTVDYTDQLAANPIQDWTSDLLPINPDFSVPIDTGAASVISSAAPVSKPSAAQTFNAAASTIQQVVSSLAPVIVGITAQNSPIVQPNATNQLLAAMLAAGATNQQALNAAAQSLAANGINPNHPAIQAQLHAGLLAALTPTDKTWLIVGGVAIVAILLFRR